MSKNGAKSGLVKGLLARFDRPPKTDLIDARTARDILLSNEQKLLELMKFKNKVIWVYFFLNFIIILAWVIKVYSGASAGRVSQAQFEREIDRMKEKWRESKHRSQPFSNKSIIVN